VTALASEAASTVGLFPSPQEQASRQATSSILFVRRDGSTDDDERQQLLEQIVELYADVAGSIASRYRGRGVDLEDLRQAAFLGLVNAVHRYRLETGVPFLGFAIPTIQGEVKRYFRDYAWTIRIPRRLQEVQRLIAAQAPQLEQELNRRPTSAEIAARLQVGADEIDRALAARGCFTLLSLDQPVHAAGELSLGDLLPSEEDRTLAQFEQVDELRPALEALSQRERRVLQLRFVEGWSQAAIAADVGVSQMQISRILTRVLSSLRSRLLAA
jgi:RNA polymerase sigma-B factor